MTGIDTNVLVRYITQDDSKQASVATDFLEASCTKESPGYINHVVLCELAWVLGHAYTYPKTTVIEVLKQLLSTAELIVETPDASLGSFAKF